jgi:hypothetical protein
MGSVLERGQIYYLAQPFNATDPSTGSVPLILIVYRYETVILQSERRFSHQLPFWMYKNKGDVVKIAESTRPPSKLTHNAQFPILSLKQAISYQINRSLITDN